MQTYRGVQTYRGCIQAYGGIQMYGAYGHPLSLTKHAFFVLCLYRGIQTSYKHIGGIQTYGGVQAYRGIQKQGGTKT